MSAYLKLATPMIDQECLLDALADVGFGRKKVEVHEAPTSLVGYEGRARASAAEIVIRRQHLSPASNDVGFVRTSTGFSLIVSNYDRSRFGQPWLREVNARYEHHARRKEERLAEAERRRLEEERRKLVEAQRQAIHDKARKMGYRVEETREGEKVRMVLVKRVY